MGTAKRHDRLRARAAAAFARRVEGPPRGRDRRRAGGQRGEEGRPRVVESGSRPAARGLRRHQRGGDRASRSRRSPRGIPKSPLLEPAVRWLLLNRNYGAWWSSTKQTAMALYGLLDYMRARQEGAADATVDVVLNGATVGTRTFTAASLTAPDPIVLEAPASAGRNTLLIRKRGGGTLYWSAAAEYFDVPAAPVSRSIAAARGSWRSRGGTSRWFP